LSVEILRGSTAVQEPLMTEWSGLCDEGPCDQLFYRPEWFSAYLHAFEPRAPLVLITARRAGRLRAVLPLVDEHALFHGLPVRRLRLPANIHSYRADLVHGAGDFREAAHALWDQLKTIPGWDLIEIRDVPEASATEQVLDFADNGRWPTGKWMSMRTPYIPLAGARSLAEVLEAQTTPKFRSNLRRLRKKLQAQGPIELRRIEQADRSVLDSFYALERAGWKGAEGSAIDCNPETRQFYDQVARLAARVGRLSLYVLEHKGRPLAIHFGVTSRDRYFLLKPAYDEAFSEYGPGKLLMEMVVEDCVARGFVELDFLGDSMPWKADWTSHLRRHWFSYVFRKSVYGSILHAAKFSIGPLVRETFLERRAP
jgi:CelD/BcsL family acetyltransferase involved in cellulose biosynthesis